MKTRAWRTPLSIWVAAVLFSLIALPSFIQLAKIATPQALPQIGASILFGVAVVAYKAFALVRLSRWPILLHAASVAASLVGRYVTHFEWRERFPLLGRSSSSFPWRSTSPSPCPTGAG
jgi:hypothetical protein